MVGFSDLPNELVLEILRHVPPRDLASACTITKSVSLLAAPILEEHRRLKQQFSPYPNVDISKLLVDTVATPRIAHYVRSLHVDYATLELWKLHNFASGSDAESLQHVKTAIANIRILGMNEVDEWLQAFQDRTADHLALALLLLVLPNLNSLHVTLFHGSTAFLSMTAQKLQNAPTGTYLPYLKHLSINCAWIGSIMERSDILSFLISLLALPSLASCRIQCLDIYDKDCAIESIKCPQKFNITDLVFTGCNIEKNTLLELLGKTRSLELFQYNLFPSSAQSEDASLDWYWLANGLSCHSKHSLKRLRLQSNGQAYRDEKSWIRSIRDLKVLQEIHIELPVFLKSDESIIRTFQDILPASIREICITTLIDGPKPKDESKELEQIREVVLSILEVKSMLVPQLMKIRVLTYHKARCTIFADTGKACALQGISFTLD